MADILGRWYTFDDILGYEVRRVGDCFWDLRIRENGRVLRLNNAEFEWLRSNERPRPRGLR